MSGSRKYILLVDKNQEIITALARELQTWAQARSVDILRAASAKEGLLLVEQFGADIYVVISELKMIDMSGSDFLVLLGRSHPHIVALILSDLPDIDEIMKSVRANMFSLIRLPWDKWNLRIELSMAYEMAENRRMGSKSALPKPASIEMEVGTGRAILHEFD